MTVDKCISNFINGDVTAFDEIYNQTRKSVYYVALSIVGDKSLAEDIMQTTYLKVLKNIHSYKIGTNATAWIVRIAKNEALNIKKVRNRECVVDESENLHLFSVSKEDEHGELIDFASQILQKDEFMILMLIIDCRYKRKEIAKMLDIPISTVTWKYKNAISKLKKNLKDEDGV